MSLQIAMAAAQAGLSILGGMAENAAIEKAATEQYNANKLFIERDQSVLNENLLYAGQEVQNQAGMALTNLIYTSKKEFAKQEAARAETNIYGNTAARQQAAADMRKELSKDAIMQQAEAALVDVNNKLRDAKYQTEAKHVQNAQNYNNMMSQRKSTFDLVMGGVSAGMQGYSQANSYMSSQNAFAIQSAQAEMMNVTLPYPATK